MTADQDVNNGLNGIDGTGASLAWRPVYVRARTILGHATKLIPFSRGNSASTPSAYDYMEGCAEQIAPRYNASDGNVWDFHDKLRVDIELLIADTDPAKLAAARAAASVLRPWPAGWPGTPPFEVGK
jgi:hypothetical protein